MTGTDGGKAAAPDEGGCLVRFPHLDVAILDGTVYTTTQGLLPLGPLAAAAASCWRLPPGGDSRPDETTMASTMIVVVSGPSSHRLTIDPRPSAGASRQIERQVAEFNLLAMRARSAAADDGYSEPDLFPPVVDADAG